MFYDAQLYRISNFPNISTFTQWPSIYSDVFLHATRQCDIKSLYFGGPLLCDELQKIISDVAYLQWSLCKDLALPPQITINPHAVGGTTQNHHTIWISCIENHILYLIPKQLIDTDNLTLDDVAL
jgi:hypothetical protein